MLASCSIYKDSRLKNPDKSDQSDQSSVWGTQASTRIPKIKETATYEEGIRDLVLQIVSRLRGEGLLTVVIGDFVEGRSGSRVPLSELIESDIRATLARVEDIEVWDRNEVSSDLLLTGLFRTDGDVLRINATMKDGKTGAITAAGRVLIRAIDIKISENDLILKESPKFSPLQREEEEGLSYDVAIEQVLTAENNVAPFNVTVWTDKNQLRIGEPVTFYFRVDRDCYLTLLDQGTSGTLRVLFPNPYQKDNFIRSGKLYAVPDPASGYEIRVEGPPGIERVKVIASLKKSQLPVEIADRFYEIDPADPVYARDLTLAVKKLTDQQWAEDYLEIDIFSPGSTDIGHQRKIKPKRPEKPVDIIGTPGVIENGRPRTIEPKKPDKPVDILGVPGVKSEE